MTDILFTHGFFLRFDEKQWRTMQPYPPLGALYAASFLRSQYQVELFDPMFAESPDEILAPLEKHSPRLVILHEDNFNWLSKMCLTRMRDASLKMIQHVKTTLGVTTPVVVVGSDATDHRELYFEAGADFLVVGESEQTLVELAEILLRKGEQNPKEIPGLSFKKDGALVNTANRSYIKQLDELPFPAWDLVKKEDYRKHWVERHGYFSVNLVTTRGCPYKCNWCAKPIYGNRYNSRSPENVALEMKWLKDNWAPDHIWFADDIFGLKPDWVDAFALQVEQKNARIPFKIQGRVDLMSEKFVASLKKAGCKTAWIGAESGSQKILNAMDKGTKVEEIVAACERLKRHGIEACFFLQFGYPGETEEDIENTIQMVRACQPDDIGISVSYPLPGTKFYDTVKEQLQQKQNWEHSDDLAMMFAGEFEPDFYRQLHKVVHHDFRFYKAFGQFSKPDGFSKFRSKNIKQLFAAGSRLPLLYLARKRLRKLKVKNQNSFSPLIGGSAQEKSPVNA